MSTSSPAMSAAPAELRYGSGRGRAALVATVAASAMGQLDATVVNVALPHISADLDVDVSALQWVLTGYLVTLASLTLLGGALGDRYGRRRIFLVGTVWFAVASVLCAASQQSGVLIAARVSARSQERRCSHPAAWRSCKRASPRTIGPAPSAPGRRSVVSPAHSVRSSGAGSSTGPGGDGRS